MLHHQLEQSDLIEGHDVRSLLAIVHSSPLVARGSPCATARSSTTMAERSENGESPDTYFSPHVFCLRLAAKKAAPSIDIT